MIRMLLIGYCMGIRSERRLCDEVHLNLAYRWFCKLGLDGKVPDHSTFSRNRHGRFRDSDLLRRLFETVVRQCMLESSPPTRTISAPFPVWTGLRQATRMPLAVRGKDELADETAEDLFYRFGPSSVELDLLMAAKSERRRELPFVGERAR